MESFGQNPFDGGWQSDDPGRFPIGMESGFVDESDSGEKGGSRFDGADIGKQFDFDSDGFWSFVGMDAGKCKRSEDEGGGEDVMWTNHGGPG